MKLKTDYPLDSLNTFGIKVDGKYFTRVASVDEIGETAEFARLHNIPLLVLGGGSNMLFTRNYDGLVMKVDLMGISKVGETNNHVYIKVGAGENWDDFVKYCVERNRAGIENLSLIPGNVGASPIQNIGAYGVQMEDHFEELDFCHFEKNHIVSYSKEDCAFGYRDSIFKKTLKGKGVVTSVTFRLDKNPVLKTGYGNIREELEQMKVKEPTIQDLRESVIRIRTRKLPDPKVLGNAGSFFKNPTVAVEMREKLLASHPGLVSFSQPDGTFKLAAGWLIEQCGWKGVRVGDAGVHKDQALVLVNFGGATGNEIFDLSEQVRDSVKNKFGIELEREVNVY
ncbi:MAG: UDP-N-acetylmuramate dehydrogenase [Bacteroidales bacterium]